MDQLIGCQSAVTPHRIGRFAYSTHLNSIDY